MTQFYLTLAKACHVVPALRRLFWRYVYQRLARSYTIPEWTFMNYGYVPLTGEQDVPLERNDEPNRSLISLYHHVASAVDLANKDVLEIGSGRGGGASYVKRYLKPRQVIGVDISENAVAFCQKRHPIDGLHFQKGDSESLRFETESFDAVLNVESSHCYGSMDQFYSEVYRVLRTGGVFLYADFRPKFEAPLIEEKLLSARFTITEHQEITPNVVAALERDSSTKDSWISELAEEHLLEVLRTFAATSGTKLFQELKNRNLVYFRFVATKE